MATKAKIEANRKNALKSTGPNVTKSTRFNALKHGLLAEGITELDDLDYAAFIRDMKSCLEPKGPLENFLVERICICMVRLRRANMLEAEYITGELNRPFIKTEPGVFSDNLAEYTDKVFVVDPGLPARLSESAVDSLTSKFQRYETSIEKKLFRTMNQLERIQRIRQSESVPPASLQVDMTIGKDTVGSFGNSRQEL